MLALEESDQPVWLTLEVLRRKNPALAFRRSNIRYSKGTRFALALVYCVRVPALPGGVSRRRLARVFPVLAALPLCILFKRLNSPDPFP